MENMEVPLEDYDPFVVEGQIKVESLNYHGKTLKFFMMEHHDVIPEDSSYLEIVSTKWKERLNDEFKSGDSVFLEYFPPELKIAQSLPIVGPFVGMWMRANGIDLFADMAEVINVKGGRVKVADVASGPLYAYHELAIDQIKWKEEMAKRSPEDRHGYAGGRSGSIDPLEIQMPRAIDARRLMPARAMMQDSAENILWIGPEAHGKRMQLYVQRQIEFEATHGTIQNPIEMTKHCPPEEAIKVEKYKRTIGFNNQVRTFSKNKLGWWRIESKQKIY